MAGSVNKVILIGNLGRDPEIRTLNNGDRVASFSLATSESWRDKASGERKEKTEWHNVVVFGDGLVKVVENYVSKGSTIYIEGQLQTRKWEKDGVDRYTTEVVLRGFNGALTLLGGKRDGGEQRPSSGGSSSGQAREQYDLNDDIPFVRLAMDHEV